MGLQRKPPTTKRRGRHPVSDLSAKFVSTIDKAGKYWDGNGLILVVQPTGSRSWIQRLTIRGRRYDLGLGGFPAVSLKEARARAAANFETLRAGGDPAAEKRRSKSIPKFSAAAAKVVEQKRPGWDNPRQAKQWQASLETYVFPYVGERSVARVTSADVLDILMPIWHKKQETARRVRARIGAVMEWAVAMDFRADNPCDRLKTMLPRQKDVRKHMQALHHSGVSAAIARVQKSQASKSTKLAFEFLVLTAARSGEVRGAKWDEIDLVSEAWLIPAERMKANREHCVPLSRRAVQILEMARSLQNASGLVFPSPRSRALSDMTLSKLLRDQGIPAVPHGFRSSFRDWAAERTNHRREAIEAALAHTIRNPTEAAYARTDYFDLRRPLMDEWATYLGKSGIGAD